MGPLCVCDCVGGPGPEQAEDQLLMALLRIWGIEGSSCPFGGTPHGALPVTSTCPPAHLSWAPRPLGRGEEDSPDEGGCCPVRDRRHVGTGCRPGGLQASLDGGHRGSQTSLHKAPQVDLGETGPRGEDMVVAPLVSECMGCGGSAWPLSQPGRVRQKDGHLGPCLP